MLKEYLPESTRRKRGKMWAGVYLWVFGANVDREDDDRKPNDRPDEENPLTQQSEDE
jgi:hypothetical protein